MLWSGKSLQLKPAANTLELVWQEINVWIIIYDHCTWLCNQIKKKINYKPTRSEIVYDDNSSMNA